MPALFLLPVLVAFYLVLVRPQRQRVNAQRAVLTSLVVGDEVMTAGGLIGTVAALGEGEISLEIAPGTVVRFAVPAIVRRMSQATTTPTGTDGFHDDILDIDAEAGADRPVSRRDRHEGAE